MATVMASCVNGDRFFGCLGWTLTPMGPVYFHR